MQNHNSKLKTFWQGRRVFVTGHTGFKGSWLCLLLDFLGASVTGYALEPPTKPSLFEICEIKELITSIHGDVRDLSFLAKTLKKAKPEFVIHMAAQPIVRESYRVPVETFEINVMGTVNLLEAVRMCPSVKSVVVVTTDKVYENIGKKSGYSEGEPLGGYDPYSSSKAAAELVASAYQQSYGVRIATARAGNVIGGGDFAADRLVPDFVRSIINGKPINIRSPKAVRPWQHVLEPLCGYLLLAQKVGAGAWNFGPAKKDAKTVEYVVKRLCEKWKVPVAQTFRSAGRSKDLRYKEAHHLELDSKKAQTKLHWKPKWSLEQSLAKIAQWIKAYLAGQDMRKTSVLQIKEYLNG